MQEGFRASFLNEAGPSFKDLAASLKELGINLDDLKEAWDNFSWEDFGGSVGSLFSTTNGLDSLLELEVAE